MTPGWFDLPAPVLDGVDQVLAMALPEWLRVAIYGLVVSYLGMVIYSRVSNQGRLRAVQRQTRRVRRRLHDPEIAFDALLAASRRSLVLSLRHLGLVLLPSLFTLLPLLFGAKDLVGMARRIGQLLNRFIRSDNELKRSRPPIKPAMCRWTRPGASPRPGRRRNSQSGSTTTSSRRPRGVAPARCCTRDTGGIASSAIPRANCRSASATWKSTSRFRRTSC